MLKKTRTMITLDPVTLKEAQDKCKRKGMKLSSVIELMLQEFIQKE